MQTVAGAEFERTAIRTSSSVIEWSDIPQVVAMVSSDLAEAARASRRRRGRVTERRNILALIDAGREDEAVNLLAEGFHLAAAVGSRSTKAALEAAARLYAGDLLDTAYFMNRPHQCLEGQSPIERAEESDEGLELVLNMIGSIEAGVYI
ncbi:MbcA/ParS/Xre antitoxin family protein [Altererythrobacter sp. C41]|uniref:MbcA/ParS/Xre antitoxin family protein n=1 Tax=Altererythrobacter sp. C41 TaxID=2806021 RepID=UPI001931DBE9|nr:MbcA/ParS/Xre antitoxin family protein [Altererythrobacter sp. C41]MBM0169531.1 DUF2384 domain-containing protein [Altererythrobacter sp. C41]